MGRGRGMGRRRSGGGRSRWGGVGEDVGVTGCIE